MMLATITVNAQYLPDTVVVIANTSADLIEYLLGMKPSQEKFFGY
jgi:hypothetical protein